MRVLEVTKGETLLVYGAAGGVGSMAVQIAVARGATVIAADSPHHAGYLRSIAAPVGDDAPARDRVRALAPDGVDAVFDTVGHGLIAASIGLGRTAARFASVVDFDPPATRPVFARLESADLHEVARLAEAGQLRPKVGVVLPLAEAPEAHRLAATRHGRGRIVLRISGGPTEY